MTTRSMVAAAHYDGFIAGLEQQPKVATLVGRAFKAIGGFVGPHVEEAINASEQYRHVANASENLSFTHTAMSAFKDHALGAEQVLDGWGKVRNNISDLDAGLGSLAMGKYNPASRVSGLRKSTFFDADNQLKNSSGLKSSAGVPGATGANYTEFGVPSISKPLKTVGKLAVPMLAWQKGMEYTQAYQDSQKLKQQQDGLQA